MITNEKRFEEDIEFFLLSSAGGYTHITDIYDPDAGLHVDRQNKEHLSIEDGCLLFVFGWNRKKVDASIWLDAL